jgi:protein-tyrosine phosphatase
MDDRSQPGGRNDGHVFDYSWITDKIIIGSDLCKGGVCLIHGEEFKKLGVNIEINLSKENNELPPKDIEVGYLWLPVTDGYAPTIDQLKIGTCLIDTAVNAGKTVFVHCRNGHARSPSMVAAYLAKYKDMSLDEALKLIKEKRPESHIEETQKKALGDFVQND